MRHTWLVLLVLPLSVVAQDTARYGIALDAKAYPQSTARETLASVLKAIDAKKVDYLVAHLADPSFVDARVKRVYAGKFDEQVQDTRTRLDPATVKKLRKFEKDGKWAVEKDFAAVTLEDARERIVRLVQKGGRWYLSHNAVP